MTQKRIYQAIPWRMIFAIVIFLALAAPQLHLPGPSSDEMDTVVLTMQMLRGLPSDAGYSVRWGNLELPLTVQAYVGTAYTYLLLPFFAVGGINIISVRVMTLTVGAAIIVFAYLFLQDFYDRRVAWWTTALLATSPSFIFWNRIGVFPKTSALLAAGALLCCAWRWYQGRGAGYLYAAAFFGGFGINSHPIFIWPVFAYCLSALILRRAALVKKTWGRLRWYDGLGAGISFLLSGWGIIWYNLRTGGSFAVVWRNARRTELYGVNNFDFGRNLLTQLRSLLELLDGSSFFDHGGVYHVPFITPIFIAATVSIIILLIARKTAYAPRRVIFALLVTGFIIVQSCFTITGFATYHLNVLFPFPYLIIALACSEICQPHRAAIYRHLVRLVILILVGAQVWTVLNYHQALHRSGGTRLVSAAIYDLAAYLQEHNIANPIAGDWGFKKNVQVLTRGRVNPLEVFEYSNQPGAAYRNRVRGYLFDPHARYLFHPPSRTTFAGHFGQLEALARDLGKELRVEQTFYERDGTPIYQLYVARQFTPPEISHKLKVNFDNTITLLGYDIRPILSRGDTTRVTLYWQAQTAPPRDYTVFIHVLDAAHTIVAQTDSMPNNGSYPTTAWLPGEIVVDHHHITISPAAEPGTYRIIAGLYDAQTMTRLPITDSAGDHAARLGELEIIAD